MSENKCICSGGFIRGHRWDCPAGKGTIRENQTDGFNKGEWVSKKRFEELLWSHEVLITHHAEHHKKEK